MSADRNVYLLTIAVDYDQAREAMKDLGTHKLFRGVFESRGVEVFWSGSGMGCTVCQGHGYILNETTPGYCVVGKSTCAACEGRGYRADQMRVAKAAR